MIEKSFVLIGTSFSRESERTGRDLFGSISERFVWYEDAYNERVNGLLKWEESNRAPWEHHAYDERGRETLSCVQLDGAEVPDAFPPTEGSLQSLDEIQDIAPSITATVIMSEYSPEVDDDNAEEDSRKPSIRKTYVLRDGISMLTSEEHFAYTRSTDTNGIPLVIETRSDGCVTTNDYSCCRLLSKTDFDCKKTLRSATTSQDRLYYAAEEISFAELPGAEGFPVTQHFFDALGRETATVVRASCNLPGTFVNPLADTLCDLPEQRTSVIYPEGDSSHCKTIRPSGIVAETWLEKTSAWKREIVAECGVTNTTVRWRNGKETQTKQLSGNWLRTTRESIWQDGNRFEVELLEGADIADVVTNSCTEFDLLGRAIAVTTPLGVSSNFYEEGTAKLVRSVYPDGITTEYEYDTAGNMALRRNVQTQLSNKEETVLETSDGILREVRISTTQSTSGAVRTNGVSVSRLTGLSSNIVAETENVLSSGEKISRRESLFTVEEKSSLAATSSAQSNLFGKTIFKSNIAGTTFTRYDAFACPNKIVFVLPEGTTNVVRKIAYDAVGNVVTSRTEYADGIAAEETFVYDLRGNVLEKRDAEGNVVTNSYDELGRLVQTGGATLPAKYAYDTRGRRVLLATTRDGSEWDETRWFFDDANFATNKVYTDEASQKYARNAAGKVSCAVNARGDKIVYYYDEAGRLQENPARMDTKYSAQNSSTTNGAMSRARETCVIITNTRDVATTLET